MAMVSVTADKAQVAALDRIGRGIKNFTPRVLTRAINKVGRSERTSITRKLAELSGLRQGAIRQKNVRLISASFRSLVARLQLKSSSIPLIRLAARQTRKGVTYKGLQGRVLLPSAFIAQMPTGHRGVFLRKTRKRLPIREQYAPSLITRILPQLPQIELNIAAKLQKEVETQTQVLLEQSNRA